MEAETAVGPGPQHRIIDRRWAGSAAVSAGIATRRFAVADGTTHYWRNSHILSAYKCEGLNLGAAGIIISLATLDTALGTKQFTEDIAGAAEWLASRPPFTQAHGFFTGNAGVSVALALAGQRLGRADLVSAARRRFEQAAGNSNPDFDLFSGAAGIVWAGCLLDAVLGTSWARDLAEQQVSKVRVSARMVDGVVGWDPHPDFDSSGRIYLGAAHGTAGTAMALSAWGESTGCTVTANLADEAFCSVIAHGLTPDGSNILATTAGNKKPAHHWCHGIAGFLWCLLQASPGRQLTDSHVRETAVAAFDQGTPLLDNPTMCHGLAGVMETWRMLESVPDFRGRARHQVCRLVDTLRMLHHTQGSASVWSSESPSVVTPDLWVGFLGPAVQLALANADSDQAVLSPTWLQRCAIPLDI
ncbi:lanthionine synthetase LanC family protein [Streptomyces sp. NBC_01013]|uniref:lanthionine synthetase LanC family protein n=1 Tax=Streptomyces sp. NBC_01013 TaxID=2903718 RepID=UPI00386D6D95|nr:hypothetical protein OG538_35560 [Streptomyces sp. NBC_01013]